MSHKLMFVSTTNPNDTTGGGGCVCSPEKQFDCKPPYVIFPGNDMENIASPHVVICESCIGEAVKRCGEELFGAGEDPDVMQPRLFDDDGLPEV